MVFKDIDTKEKCDDVEGKALIDSAWDSYIGCAPNLSSEKSSLTLTDEDIKFELNNLEELNDDPIAIDQNAYPKSLGTYSKNGLSLIEEYFCSDICPQNAFVTIIFENIVTKEDCLQIGGEVLIDAAWGEYLGCKPSV